MAWHMDQKGMGGFHQEQEDLDGSQDWVRQSESAPVITEAVSGKQGGCIVREKAIWGSAVVHISICLFAIIIIMMRIY